MDDHKKYQEEEAKTWCIEDPKKRKFKIDREIARYPMMARQMGLNFIDTSDMDIVDVGGGPVGLITILPAHRRYILDPLTDEYSKFFPCNFHIKGFAEKMPFEDNSIDLVVCTNALDHCENPDKAIVEITRILKPGGWFAHYHAIDNAINHPHPAHQFNINYEWFHDYVDDKFEMVWEQKYPEVRYSFTPFSGKIGEPAFCGLYRKAIGFD